MQNFQILDVSNLTHSSFQKTEEELIQENGKLKLVNQFIKKWLEDKIIPAIIQRNMQVPRSKFYKSRESYVFASNSQKVLHNRQFKLKCELLHESIRNINKIVSAWLENLRIEINYYKDPLANPIYIIDKDSADNKHEVRKIQYNQLTEEKLSLVYTDYPKLIAALYQRVLEDKATPVLEHHFNLLAASTDSSVDTYKCIFNEYVQFTSFCKRKIVEIKKDFNVMKENIKLFQFNSLRVFAMADAGKYIAPNWFTIAWRNLGYYSNFDSPNRVKREEDKKLIEKKEESILDKPSAESQINFLLERSNIEKLSIDDREDQISQKPSLPSQEDSSVIDAKRTSALALLTSSLTLQSVCEEFWEENDHNKDLSRLLHRMFINQTNDEMIDQDKEKTKKEKIDFVIDYYINCKKKFNSLFVLSDEQKSFLAQMIVEQFAYKKSSTEDILLSDEKLLKVYETSSDGSCAFHALLGQPNLDNIYTCDARKNREIFCAWLNKHFFANTLPVAIKTTLEDYFLNFTIAPSFFKNAVRDSYNKYYNGYLSISKEEQDKRVEDFIRDPHVFKSYIDHLKKIDTYISQDELFALAECFNIELTLYQPDWSNKDKYGQISQNVKDSKSEKVHILYKNNHFARAELLPHFKHG